MSLEIILLGLSVLFLLSIMAGKASSKFGVPALLLFLLVGMLCGSDGLGIQFDNTYVAQTVGTVALCIILFSGGVLDHAVIGEGSIVGAGAVVAAGTIVPPRSLVVGVPAKVKKTLTDEDVAANIANADSYLALMTIGRDDPENQG